VSLALRVRGHANDKTSMPKTTERGTVLDRLTSSSICPCTLSSITIRLLLSGRSDSVLDISELTRRPYDCRMWTALATVYEGLQR
jgi:hypothetical protein